MKCSPPTYIRGYQKLCLKEGRKNRDGRREGKKEGRNEGREESWKEGKSERRLRRDKEDATNSIVEDLLCEVTIELIKNSCCYGKED